MAVHGHLGQVVVHGNPIARGIVVGGAVGHLDEQAAGLVDEEREKVMRRDEVGLDGEPQDSQTIVEVVLPDGRVPLRRSALQHFGAPDVVDEHVDVAVVRPNLLGQRLHLAGIEMVDCGGDTGAAELRDELGRFFESARSP